MFLILNGKEIYLISNIFQTSLFSIVVLRLSCSH